MWNQFHDWRHWGRSLKRNVSHLLSSRNTFRDFQIELTEISKTTFNNTFCFTQIITNVMLLPSRNWHFTQDTFEPFGQTRFGEKITHDCYHKITVLNFCEYANTWNKSTKDEKKAFISWFWTHMLDQENETQYTQSSNKSISHIKCETMIPAFHISVTSTRHVLLWERRTTCFINLRKLN